MQTGADALAQAIGGVIVRNGNPGSVALGLEACAHVAAGLGPAVADGGDRAARSRLSLGSLLAGLAMNLSDCGADHALGHALGGRLGLPHGLSVGLVLAETLDVDRARLPAGARAGGRRALRAARRPPPTAPGRCGPCAASWRRSAFPPAPRRACREDDVDALVRRRPGRLLPHREPARLDGGGRPRRLR